MDLEYYRHRQLESQAMSQNAACNCSRLVHRKLADAYGLLVANGDSVTTKRPLESGGRMAPLEAAQLPAKRRSFKLPADTAAGCRDRAAADLLASLAMSTPNSRRRLETSAASWTARANLLQRDEEEFRALKLRA